MKGGGTLFRKKFPVSDETKLALESISPGRSLLRPPSTPLRGFRAEYFKRVLFPLLIFIVRSSQATPLISLMNAISVEQQPQTSLIPEKVIKISIKTFHLYGQTPHETAQCQCQCQDRKPSSWLRFWQHVARDWAGGDGEIYTRSLVDLIKKLQKCSVISKWHKFLLVARSVVFFGSARSKAARERNERKYVFTFRQH
jgi:hypothetical protein